MNTIGSATKILSEIDEPKFSELARNAHNPVASGIGYEIRMHGSPLKYLEFLGQSKNARAFALFAFVYAVLTSKRRVKELEPLVKLDATVYRRYKAHYKRVEVVRNRMKVNRHPGDNHGVRTD